MLAGGKHTLIILDAPKAFSLRRRCRGCAATDEVLRIQHPFTIPAVDDIGLDLINVRLRQAVAGGARPRRI